MDRNDFRSRPLSHGDTAQTTAIFGHPGAIALQFAVVGLVWVVLSQLLLIRVPQSLLFNRLLFVAGITLLLYAVERRYTRTIQIATASREEALARARGYFESSVEGIVTADSTGLIRQMNPRGQALFGYTEAELVGRPIETLIPARLRDRHQEHRKAFFGDPHSRWMGQGMEIAGRRKDGKEFHAEVSLNVVHTRHGALVIAFVSDITERRAMEREARRNETLNALGAVAAGIAHELNNPLAVIASRIELMLMADDLSTETRDDLLVLQRNVERASRISHNMLSLARQRPGLRSQLDMNTVVEQATALMGTEGRGGTVAVETNLDRSLRPVMGDPTALEQVLVNLITNARDAGARRVRIETGAAPERPGHLRLAVIDDGAGIEPAAKAKLFEPFVTTKPGGTGLGLWLSQRIVRDHGGTIEAASEPGAGATFAVTLPTVGTAASEPALASTNVDSPNVDSPQPRPAVARISQSGS